MDFFEKIVINISSGIIGSAITLFFTSKLSTTDIYLITGSVVFILGIAFVVHNRNKKETEK